MTRSVPNLNATVGTDPDARTNIDDIWPHLDDTWREEIAMECASGEDHRTAKQALQGSLLAGYTLGGNVLEAAERIADDLGVRYKNRIYHWLDELEG